MILKPTPHQLPLSVTWEALPADFILPDDPVENILQPFLAAALTDALDTAGLVTSERLLASNFGLVAMVNGKVVVKAPDWLYVPKVNPIHGVVRRSYTPMLQGEAVAIVMEFLSEEETGEYSSRPLYPYGKFYFYEQILKVPFYVIFDPKTALLEVRKLKQNASETHYALQTPDAENRYWIPELNLLLGVWQGERLGLSTSWLRWWDSSGNILLWGSEKAEQAQQQAEQAQQQAGQAQQQTEQAQQQAEQERNARVQAVPKLIEMGLSAEQVADALGLSADDVNQMIRGS
jgi:Uma2 family endonuclease